jgi:hypothetical protein
MTDLAAARDLAVTPLAPFRIRQQQRRRFPLIGKAGPERHRQFIAIHRTGTR